jgi:hypothetical protein
MPDRSAYRARRWAGSDGSQRIPGPGPPDPSGPLGPPPEPPPLEPPLAPGRSPKRPPCAGPGCRSLHWLPQGEPSPSPWPSWPSPCPPAGRRGCQGRSGVPSGGGAKGLLWRRQEAAAARAAARKRAHRSRPKPPEPPWPEPDRSPAHLRTLAARGALPVPRARRRPPVAEWEKGAARAAGAEGVGDCGPASGVRLPLDGLWRQRVHRAGYVSGARAQAFVPVPGQRPVRKRRSPARTVFTGRILPRRYLPATPPSRGGRPECRYRC